MKNWKQQIKKCHSTFWQKSVAGEKMSTQNLVSKSSSDPRNRPSDPENGVWGPRNGVWGSKIRPKSHSRPSKMVRRTKNRCKIVKMTFEFSSIVILLFCCFGVWCLKSQNWNLIPFLNLEPSNRLFKWP